MENILEQRVGDIVTENFRTAEVFSNHGLDFCCGGKKPLKDALEAKEGIDKNKILKQLEDVLNMGTKGDINFNEMSLDLLADYIEKTHHRYAKSKIPVIEQYLNKVATVHGGRHPEVIEINNLFQESIQELTSHFVKEENILFPFIRSMVEAELNNKPFTPPMFGTVENPVTMMVHEHDIEGERFKKISELSDNYTPPTNVCSTYRVTYAMLKEFEEDLHKHIHLENNILFPKAIALEKSLRTK